MRTKHFLPVLLISLIALFSCDFKEPVLPTWSIPLTIPLSTERFILADELQNDSTFVLNGSDSTLYISIDDQLEPEEITAADLSVEGQQSSVFLHVDTLQLVDMETISTGQISMLTVFPDLANNIGSYVPVPAQTFSPDPEVLPAGDFKALRVVDGAIQITVYNNLPFALGPNSQTPQGIEIVILNDSTNTEISRIQIPQVIEPGSAASGSSPIGNGNSWVYSPIRLEYTLPIARDTVLLVTDSLLNAANYQIDLTISNVRATELIAQIEPQHFNYKWKTELDSRNKIIEGRVKSGEAIIYFQNSVALGGVVQFTIPDLLTPQGTPYQDQISVVPNDITVKRINLNGYRFVNSKNPGQVLDSLELEMDVLTDSTTSEVHISTANQFGAQIQLSNLEFDYLKGFLSRDTLHLEPFSADNIVDYKGIEPDFNFKGAELLIELENQIYIDTLLLNLDIYGYHRDKNGIITDSAAIHIKNQKITAGSKNNPQTTQILLKGPEIDQFLSSMPTDIKGGGQVVYGGLSEVEAGASISARYHFFTPLKFSISTPILVESDVDTLTDADISQEFRDAAGNQLQSARLNATVTNMSPIAGAIEIYVSADMNHTDLFDTTGYFNSALEFVKRIDFEAATIDPTTGWALEPSQNQIVLELNNEEVRLFQNPPVRIGYKLYLDKTNQTVVLRGSDYIEISGKFEFNVMIKED